MDHRDHVRLLQQAVPDTGGTWADLGSGDGAFTLALADLLGQTGTIVSVDIDRQALNRQRNAMATRFPGASVRYLVADFTRPLDLSPLDGLVMANSLHFVRDKKPVLRRLLGYLKPASRFVLIEYNADQGNIWVPYPLSYPTWEQLASEVGLKDTRKLASVPSRFLNEIYSALSFKADEGDER